MINAIHYGNPIYWVQVRESEQDEWQDVMSFGTRKGAEIMLEYVTERFCRIDVRD